MSKPRKKKRKNRTLQRIKNDLIYYGLRGLMVVFSWIPLYTGIKIGAAIGGWAYSLLRYERENALAHLRVAFPDKSEDWRKDIARRSFQNFGKSFFELLHFDEILDGVDGKGKFVGYVDWENEKYMAEVKARGRGGLFVTGHCGNWELMRAFVPKFGYTINTVVRQVYDKRIDKLINDHREKYGCHAITREGKEVIPEIARILQANEFIGLLMDQDTKVRGVWAPFLGELAHTPSGPAYLAYMADMDALSVYIYRRPEGGHTVTVGPPMERPQTGDLKADIQAYTAILNQAADNYIRNHPDEWVWMHRRWKKRPPDELPWMNPVPKRPKPSKELARLERTLGAYARSLSWEKADKLGQWLGSLKATFGFGKKQAMQRLRKVLPDIKANENLTAVFKASSENATRNLISLFRVPMADNGYYREHFEVENYDLFEKAKDKGKGVLLVGGRLGTMEWGLFKLAAMGNKVGLVAPPLKDDAKERWLAWRRRQGQIIPITTKGAVTASMKALKDNCTVAWAVDMPMAWIKDNDKQMKRSVEALYTLSNRTGASILFAYSEEIAPGKQRLKFIELADHEMKSSQELYQAIDDQFRSILSKKPHLWPWSYSND